MHQPVPEQGTCSRAFCQGTKIPRGARQHRGAERIAALSRSPGGDLGDGARRIESYALLTVLEQLSPAERTAIVLHDIFDMPFAEIGRVVGRRTEAVRQLASRARRHIKRGRPRFEASREEHDRAVRASARAVAEGKPRRAPRGPRSRCRLHIGRRRSRAAVGTPRRSGERVARSCAALCRVVDDWVEINLNGRLGLLLSADDGRRTALSFVISDGRITRIDAIRNPEKLRHL